MILVEGPSDVAALEALATRVGCPLAGPARVLAMGGATNIGRYLDRYPPGGRPRPLGLCDAAESPFFSRALAWHGVQAPDHAALAAAGFFVCDPDLETELLGALGEDGALAVLAARGEAAAFRAFQGQVAWRDRPVLEQLHRFAGVRAGRKRSLAGDLADAVELDAVPVPLRGLLREAAG